MIDPAELETHRTALTGHCYRMLGSPADADDAVQETIVRAWKSLERFDGRSTLRTWLTRIATNVCLDLLADRSARRRPLEEGPAGTIHDDLQTRPRTHWLEPVPDARVLPDDPSERASMRQSIRLAFVSALQKLPPNQRAALLLADVVGWSAAEVADALQMSVPAVNSALQRARAAVPARETGPGELTETQAKLVERYVDAFERYDVDALAALLREDAILNMPPYTLWLRGREAMKGWFLARGVGCRGSKLLPTAACGSPAFAQYKPAPDGTRRAWALVVLELDGDRIATQTFFLDVEHLFPLFGFPLIEP